MSFILEFHFSGEKNGILQAYKLPMFVGVIFLLMKETSRIPTYPSLVPQTQKKNVQKLRSPREPTTFCVCVQVGHLIRKIGSSRKDYLFEIVWGFSIIQSFGTMTYFGTSKGTEVSPPRHPKGRFQQQT